MNANSIEDRILIIKCYYKSGESTTSALRMFKMQRNLTKDPFSKQSIRLIVDKFETNGSVLDKPKSSRPSLQDERVEAVNDALKLEASEIGCSSSRRISQSTGIPHTSVYKILRKKLCLYPYKFSMLHEIKPTDVPLRFNFAQKMLENYGTVEKVLWTDECHFYINGAINTKNCVIWSSKNPNAYRSIPLHSDKVTVWMGISKHFCIQPFFFHETVTGERYLAMLKDHLLPNLKKKRKFSSVIFMQDGAPAHIYNPVKEFLIRHFGNDRVISRHFPNFWPPRSPDINPCDYWLWGYIQALVYQHNPPKNKEELVARITEAIVNIPRETTAAAIDNIQKRFEAVVTESGGHFQHLL